jgi:hypothetical protein
MLTEYAGCGYYYQGLEEAGMVRLLSAGELMRQGERARRIGRREARVDW